MENGQAQDFQKILCLWRIPPFIRSPLMKQSFDQYYKPDRDQPTITRTIFPHFVTVPLPDNKLIESSSLVSIPTITRTTTTTTTAPPLPSPLEKHPCQHLYSFRLLVTLNWHTYFLHKNTASNKQTEHPSSSQRCTQTISNSHIGWLQWMCSVSH
jgi:hypothetical protein